MRHDIAIESLTNTRDPQGGMVKTWNIFKELRAKIINLSGNEDDATTHGGAVGEARTEFTTRYVEGVDTSMRIVFNGRHYNILHINDWYEEHRFLILTCDTGMDDG